MSADELHDFDDVGTDSHGDWTLRTDSLAMALGYFRGTGGWLLGPDDGVFTQTEHESRAVECHSCHCAWHEAGWVEALYDPARECGRDQCDGGGGGATTDSALEGMHRAAADLIELIRDCPRATREAAPPLIKALGAALVQIVELLESPGATHTGDPPFDEIMRRAREWDENRLGQPKP